MKLRNRDKKSNSWLCFRPHTMEDEHDFEPRSIDSPVYIAVKPQTTSPEKILTKEISLSTEKSPSSRRRRALSGIFKAVLFETVLIKSRKVQQDPSHTLKNIQELRSSRQEDVTSLKISSKNRKTQQLPLKKPSKEDDKRSSKIPAATTVTTSLFTQASSSPPKRSFELGQTVSEDSNPGKTKTKKITKNHNNSSLNGLCLLLISLIMLVFWGRVCAIISTSAWIYFGPSFRQKNEQEEEVEAGVTRKAEEAEEMGSRQYKKRVIMEGLLERTHSRV